MKKLIITTLFLLSISHAFAQDSERNSASFSLGDGISFSFNEGNYEFNIFGFIKPTYIYKDEEIYTSGGEFSNDMQYLEKSYLIHHFQENIIML